MTMNSILQNLIVTEHAYERYLQRYIGNNLSKVELEYRLNQVEVERVEGFGEEVLLIDDIYWCISLGTISGREGNPLNSIIN